MIKLALIAFAFAFSNFVFGTEKTVDIRSSFDVPGYNEIDNCGNKTGFEIELTEAIFKSQGYSVKWNAVTWDDIVADLKVHSGDKDYGYVASLEGRDERKANWLFAGAVEFDASHYFFGGKNLSVHTGIVTDTETGKRVSDFVLDEVGNRVNGRRLKIATWKGSAFEIELRRVFPDPKHVEIVAMESGNPIKWLSEGTADLAYAFASGPVNEYTKAGYLVFGGPITNFDIDRFGGTSPAFPLNKFGQEMGRVWNDGFAAIIRDNTFFEISMKWFGRVSWAADFNGFLIPDQKAFEKRIALFEEKWKAPAPQQCQP